MNNLLMLFITCSTVLFSQDIILWDLGVIIKKSPNENESIKPLISDTQIKPFYKSNIVNNINAIDLSDFKISPKHIINILYWNNQYVKLIEYIKNNIQNIGSLNDSQRLIYADAFYQVGNYSEAINNINLLSEKHPVDEKYFTLALYNKKEGNINAMIGLLEQLIHECPKSDYLKLAQLQIKGFK